MTSPIFDRRRHLGQRWVAGALAVGGVLIVLAFIALIDARVQRGKVQRNVQVAGSSVGGFDRSELNTFLDTLEGRYRTMTVGIAAPEGGFSVTGADLGVSVKRSQLATELLAIGHDGGPTRRIRAYIGSFFGSTEVKVPVSVDSVAVAATLATFDAELRVDPVDPELISEEDGFAIRPGKPGTGISGDVIVASLPVLVESGPVGPTITVDRVVLPERYTADDLKALVAEAERLTSNPLEIRVADRSATLSPKQLRSLVTPDIVNGKVTLMLNEKRALAAVAKSIGSVGEKPQDARLQVNDDSTVTAVPARVGQICCDDGAIDLLNGALAAGAINPVELRLKTVQPKVTTEQVVSLGVKELIGTFTTKHPPGEDRVKNIHQISDQLRGIVIAPGDTFSVNDTVGPRTAANGFFKAKVIEDGVFAENFGGGISQFATTMFNAAFFSGLDLVTYQSHSLYISRYPYGREATLSFPDPDLKIRNNTPYGVLIWPTYTARSITVSFYSTKYVSGEVGVQTVEKRNQCKRVYTTRIRTYTDGRTKTDRISASYRPKEGVDCNGNPTAGATTTQPKTTKPKTTKAPSQDGDSGSDAGDDTPTTRPPVRVGDDDNGGEAPASKPKTTKAPSQDPPVTKPPKTEPKPEPKPEPEPTSPPDDGGVTPAKPPVTGLG
jgi:vancomycin resistance protein YoaR